MIDSEYFRLKYFALELVSLVNRHYPQKNSSKKPFLCYRHEREAIERLTHYMWMGQRYCPDTIQIERLDAEPYASLYDHVKEIWTTQKNKALLD